MTAWLPLANTFEIYDYWLQHGAVVDVANTTRYVVHYVKT